MAHASLLIPSLITILVFTGCGAAPPSRLLDTEGPGPFVSVLEALFRTDCDGNPVNIWNDRANCGACGNDCGPGDLAFCHNGLCASWAACSYVSPFDSFVDSTLSPSKMTCYTSYSIQNPNATDAATCAKSQWGGCNVGPAGSS